ncbi:MAG: restriction endonuclease [Pirellulaceae bacterium]
MDRQQALVVRFVFGFIAVILFLLLLVLVPAAQYVLAALVLVHVIAFAAYWWFRRRSNNRIEPDVVPAPSDSETSPTDSSPMDLVTHQSDASEPLTISPLPATIKHTVNRLELIRLKDRNWRKLDGNDFVKFVAAVFKANGCVAVAAGFQREAAIDLVVTIEGVRYSVVVKSLRGEVGNSAVMQAHAGLKPHHCQRAIVATQGTYSPAARQLAEKLSVTLLDRYRISELLEGNLFFAPPPPSPLP